MKVHEIDKAKIEKARQLADELWNIVPEGYRDDSMLNISVYPAVRGGWKTGYRYSGNYRIRFTVGKEGSMKTEKIIYIPFSIEKARRAIDKIMPVVHLGHLKRSVLGVYRKSGIIPRTIAKKHSRILKEKGLDISMPEYWNEASKMAYSYVMFHGKCPHCGYKGFKEQIDGYKCRNCSRVWDDMKDSKWR